MKRTKKLLAMGLSVAVLFGSLAVLPAEAAGTISRVGNKSRTVYKGAEFELRVKRNGLSENKCYWSIDNTNIVRFEDNDRDERYDDEIELVAKKAGTTTVKCKNLRTGGIISYTVTVKNGSNTISRVGSSSRTITKGTEFELKVKKNGGFSDSKIKWTIDDRSIVEFEDGGTYEKDNDVELVAKATGTTKVRAKNTITGGSIVYTVTVKSGSKTIGRIGSATKTVYKGDDLELEVKKYGGIKDSEIVWSIDDTSILRFEDGENVGDDVEVIGRKVGTTKVRAKNTITGGSIVYTVKVK